MLPPGIQAADDLSSHSSSTPDPVNRIPLGPERAAMLQDRARGDRNLHDVHEMTTRVQPNIQTPDRLKFRPMKKQHDRGWNSAPPRDEDAGGEATTDPVGNLQTYFDAAMARFLHDRQVQQAYQDRMEAREGRGRR